MNFEFTPVQAKYIAVAIMSDSLTTTAVSLPQHLITTLEVVVDILPEELKNELSTPLKEQVEVPYAILLKISQWARTDKAHKLLASKQLSANDYTMISLLAGTITSPLSKFPKYEPPAEPAKMARKDMSDRRAILALVNALFSVGGAGYASWWASQHVGWKDEWRALFALAVALILAATEGILFVIWQSRTDSSHPKVAQLKFNKEKKKEKAEPSRDGEEISPVPVKKDTRLRRRQAGH